MTINSDHYSGVSITGKHCLAIMTQALSLDSEILKSGDTTRCRFARTAAIVHVIEQFKHYDVFVETTYTDYLIDWLAVAGGIRDKR